MEASQISRSVACKDGFILAPISTRLPKCSTGNADFVRILTICPLLPVFPGSHLQALEGVS